MGFRSCWLLASAVCLAACSDGSAPAGPTATTELDHDTPGVVVVLGSSTAAGTGPSQPESAWVERYRAYLAQEFPRFELTNLARNGYTTYEIQPTDFTPPADRPVPIPARNITAALGLAPDAIIVNMPSNDTARGYALTEQLDNYARVAQLAEQSGVQVWIASPQPRSFGDVGRRDALISAREAIVEAYSNRIIDFWSELGEADGKLKAMYDSGDGTHLNDAGHAILAERAIAAKIPEAALLATD